MILLIKKRTNNFIFYIKKIIIGKLLKLTYN